MTNYDYLSRDDPMPAVVTESMSLGKPSICSQNTGAADFIEHYDAGYTYGKRKRHRHHHTGREESAGNQK